MSSEKVDVLEVIRNAVRALAKHGCMEQASALNDARTVVERIRRALNEVPRYRAEAFSCGCCGPSVEHEPDSEGAWVRFDELHARLDAANPGELP